MRIEAADNYIASLGLEAYRVGGSVRDELLGSKPKDADYMIRGASLRELYYALIAAQRPEDPIAKVSPLKLRDGRQAGWRVARKGFGCIEIVLPRIDVPRAPEPGENVHRAFDIIVDENVSVADDALRRDFTFNALYKSCTGAPHCEQITDPTSRGMYDLQHKLVSTTHESSFRDDPLRTLRALRFVSKLGYDLSTNTYNQMMMYASEVTGLSANGYASGTVLDELSKILMGENAVKALRLARDTGVLGNLLPGLAPMLGFDQGSKYHDLTTDEHTFKAMEVAVNVDAPLRVRMALLFHDTGKPESVWTDEAGFKHYYSNGETEDHEIISERIWREAADWMNIPSDLKKQVATLIRHHMVPTSGRKMHSRVARMRVEFGDEMLSDLFLHRMCDLSGKDRGVNAKFMQYVAGMEAARKMMQDAGVPSSLKDLAINGKDMIEMGIVGRDIGRVLHAVLDEVVCSTNVEMREREWQLGAAERLR